MKIGEYIDTKYDRVIDCPHLFLPGGAPEIENAHSCAVLLHPVLVEAFNRTRHVCGEPYIISSGARCAPCQKSLVDGGKKGAAKTSEHVPLRAIGEPEENIYFYAFDIQPAGMRSATQEARLEKLAQFASHLVGINPEVRLGTKAYRDREYPIIHMGVGYLAAPNPDPVNWKPGVRW